MAARYRVFSIFKAKRDSSAGVLLAVGVYPARTSEDTIEENVCTHLASVQEHFGLKDCQVVWGGMTEVMTAPQINEMTRWRGGAKVDAGRLAKYLAEYRWALCLKTGEIL